MIIAPKPIDDYKYIKPTGLYAPTLTDCTAILVNDAAEDELAFDITSVINPLVCLLEFDFVIPADFKAFGGLADDLVVRALQDAVASLLGNLTITVVVLDSAGVVVDDSSIATIALTAAYANYDCPLVTGGTFVAGDHITVQITLDATVAGAVGDDGRITIPKLKYIPQ
jgi:hypothetical protein